MQIETRVWVSAHGFQLRDVTAEWTGEWTNSASFVDDAVGVARGVVGPTDLSRAAGQIPVIVELLERAPTDDDLDDYDGVIDAPLELSSGVLRLEGDIEIFEHGLRTTPVLRLSVAPGNYRVRIAYANNDTSRYDYADGADHVRLSLWPAAVEALTIRKRKKSQDEPAKKYRGTRSLDELRAYLGGPSISHRCLAVVALARLREVEVLVDAMANNPFDSVEAVYLAALGFAGKKALPLLADQGPEDRDLKLRIVQSLRLIGGKAARTLAAEVAEDSDFDMLNEAVEDIE